MMETTQNEYALKNTEIYRGFLATVSKVYRTEFDLQERPEFVSDEDVVSVYNNNESFTSESTIYLGAIDFRTESSIKYNPAYPLDKNNITYPIIGETVLILQILNTNYWLPFSKTIYPNYRENPSVSRQTEEKKSQRSDIKNTDFGVVKSTGIPNQAPIQTKSAESKYEKKEKIHFLRPQEGDTIITGRVGQSIRFSEFFLAENTASSPSIFIRNKQNEELDTKPIGTLIEEDINKDGSSIYITSNKVKVPLDIKQIVTKEVKAFKDFPTSDKLKGNQIYINSDRVFISSKSENVIILSKSNAGIITDGRFSVDAKNGVYLHSEGDDIVAHSVNGKNIFLNSDSSGKIYLGKNKGEGDAGADVQKMVLGGELVQVLSELIDAINQQTFLTPSGPTAVGPTNAPTFNSIKNKLKTILSVRNYLSKQ